MIHPIYPQAQEYINNCDNMSIPEWSQWYNFRLKILNDITNERRSHEHDKTQ